MKSFAIVALALCLAAAPALAADVKVSSYAPAEDLAGQVEKYVEDLDKAVASEADFDELKVTKTASALVLMAIAFSNHDQETKYKAAAGGLFKAAQELAAAKGYAPSKQGVAAVKAALASQSPAALKWEKAVGLDPIFKQSQSVLNSMKKNIKGKRFKSSAKDTAGGAAVLAVIGQGVMNDLSHAKTPEEQKQWMQFSVEMRDASAAAGAAIRAGNEDDAQAAAKKVNQSCEDCHAVFHKESK